MISAKMITDSLSPQGKRLSTLEVVMPRYILAEFNTHRMLSKNSASSRAIPFSKMVKEVQERPFIPYAWQKDHKGMQGNEYHTNYMYTHAAEQGWLRARNKAIYEANLLNKNCDVTKQLANRLLEPFMYHKVLVSGTEWENFFNLRCPEYVSGNKLGSPEANGEKVFKSWKDLYYYYMNELNSNVETLTNVKNTTIVDKLLCNKGQADIHMMFLAEAMYDAMNESIPKQLKEGEWHIPYGDNIQAGEVFHNFAGKYGTYEECIRKISIARCARLSYQTLGDNPVIDYEADLKLYEVLSKSGHWSPFEHVAKAMTDHEYNTYFKGIADYESMEGYNLTNKKGLGWCRNFQGFIQYRELLD